jgi:hypothetical protein
VGPGDRDIAALHGAPVRELAALNVEDVLISACKGIVVVRSGNGDAYREVPLNRPCRLERWLKARGECARDDGERRAVRRPAGSPGRGVAGMTREQADAIANQIAPEPHGSGPAGGVILRAG